MYIYFFFNEEIKFIIIIIIILQRKQQIKRLVLTVSVCLFYFEVKFRKKVFNMDLDHEYVIILSMLYLHWKKIKKSENVGKFF